MQPGTSRIRMEVGASDSYRYWLSSGTWKARDHCRSKRSRRHHLSTDCCRIFDGRLARSHEERGDLLLVGARRRHLVHESSDLCSKVRLAFVEKDVARSSPSTFDLLAGLH